MLDLVQRFFVNERLRHAVIAIVVAAMVALITILRPIDIVMWSTQSKLFSHSPSGDIVIVMERPDRSDKSGAGFNRQLTSTIERLSEAGVRRIVIDTPMQLSGNSQVDRNLRLALERNRDLVTLSRPIRDDIDENQLIEDGSEFFERGMRIAATDVQLDFLGFVWGIESEYTDGKTSYPAVWNVLAADGAATKAIFLDYSVNTMRLPQVALSELARGQPGALDATQGKTVVIWGAGRDRRAIKAPDDSYGDASAGLIQIVAAETALRNSGQFIGSTITIAVFGLVLLLGLAIVRGRRSRLLLYGSWGALFAAFYFASAYLGFRAMLSEPLFMAAFYALLRAIYNYRRRHIFIDPRSKLPNFAALRRDLECQEDIAGFAIVVAKVARLDAVLATLSQSEQRQYMRQVATRLNLGDAQHTVYHDGGKYFGFLVRAQDYPDLKSHLEGLRAVASQAVSVSKRTLDLSMTIGVDHSKNKSPSSRISSAIAAADQAREAYRPVFIITNFEADSETWDYSLQARLEQALTENRISIKLQPQIELQSGRIVGAEALARWVDEERGEISPARFILQCERVGRLDELTKRLLGLSFAASQSLRRQGLPSRVSANVSAIQFVDHRIADMIETALAESGTDPADIIIEVTESARIEDFAVARDIMERLGNSGIRFSIDDFGISSANLDALYRLPFFELKIDRMFVSALANDPSARTIVENMLSLSRGLGLVSVAEGIEDLATLEILRNMGGDLGQGYCIARPQTLPLLQETMKLQRDNGLQRSG